MKKKTFPARTILSVTTGRLLTKPRGIQDNGISDLYELLEWMTGEAPFTHQLPRFAEECKPYLLEWFPDLATFDLVKFDEARKNYKDGMERYLQE